MKKLIAGNWKMNMDADQADAFDLAMAATATLTHVDWVVCPPYPYIANITNVARGAQDCAAQAQGAYTGDVSATMLRDMGCDYCIVGHSERRAMHGETSELVREKSIQIIDHRMTAIICVGESLHEREEGKALDIVEGQILESLPNESVSANTVIAYEPVWAIGTGQAATPSDISKMHNYIREILKSHVADGAEMRILYGGSVKPENAAELLNLDNVGGALIGGASLNPQDFIAIGKAVA